MVEREPETISQGMRVFAALMAVFLIAVGLYAIYLGIAEDTFLVSAAGVGVIVYGALWGNLARTGRHGRVPLWP